MVYSDVDQCITDYVNLFCSMYQNYLEEGFKVQLEMTLRQCALTREDYASIISVGPLKFVIADCHGCKEHDWN